MKIVFLDESTMTLDDIDFTCLRQFGTYQSFASTSSEQIATRGHDADIIIINKVNLSRGAIEALPNLKLICVIATGYNNVDVGFAKEKGIRVCNVAGYASETVPQHTFALILNLATQAYKYNEDVKNGLWQRAPIFTLLKYPTFELAGKTIGIIGYGAIGCGVAKIADAFGMHVLVHDANVIADNRYLNTDIESLILNSDIITIHCPLTEQTRNLISAERIGKMKKNAILINTARGGIVDEAAMAGALNSGCIAGAGFDVLSEEPPRNGNVLLNAKNIIFTPHSAWSTVEARQRLVNETAENIKGFMNKKYRNVVS